jgi:hypothetical protein
MQTNNSKPTPRVNNDPGRAHDAGCATRINSVCECDCSKFNPERFDELTGGYDMVDHDRAAKRIMADIRKMPQRVDGHTPGPWRSHGEAVWSTHESVSGPVTKGTRTNHVCAVSSRLKMPEAERAANARLIASAPDLLAALQSLVNICTHPNATKSDMRMIAEESRAAIARATNGGGM